MRVAVSAVGGSLDSQIDPRFGRCQYLIIVDSDTMNFEALLNESRAAPSGAGIQAAQTVANKGVKIVLTGNVGPNAYKVFSTVGVQIITGVAGTVVEAIEKFKSDQLHQTTTTPTAPMGFGVGGSGMGIGRGGGLGLGRGQEMGYRRWQTADRDTSPPTASTLTSTPSIMSKEQEIQFLESQMGAMQRQLRQIEMRLKELKNSA